MGDILLAVVVTALFMCVVGGVLLYQKMSSMSKWDKGMDILLYAGNGISRLIHAQATRMENANTQKPPSEAEFVQHRY